MLGRLGFSRVGAIVAGAVTCVVPATAGGAFATPEPPPAAGAAPSARPSLGHFGGPADRPLKGRITPANPTGETLGFKVADPTLLPAGITIDADGLLGGTSRVPGIWTVPVEACAPSGGCVSGTVTITVTCPCAHPPAAFAPAPPFPPGPARSRSRPG